jgi:hypothetical protein
VAVGLPAHEISSGPRKRSFSVPSLSICAPLARHTTENTVFSHSSLWETAMKKFLVLYRSSISTPERMAKSTPEQAVAGMAAWRSWAERSKAALVELGAPLGESTVLKGSAPPAFIGGFSIVQAESADTAKKIFDGHPHFETPGNSIELIEQLPMPGT